RRAQKVLLNPITESNEYLNWDFKDDDNSQLHSLKFTKNVVYIKIKPDRLYKITGQILKYFSVKALGFKDHSIINYAL
ncbi:3236_t:CDS:2, partial [Gigaspora margarita]